jgi:hypothetical protein
MVCRAESHKEGGCLVQILLEQSVVGGGSWKRVALNHDNVGHIPNIFHSPAVPRCLLYNL